MLPYVLELEKLDSDTLSYAMGLHKQGEHSKAKDILLELKQKYPKNLIILSYLLEQYKRLSEGGESEKIKKIIIDLGQEPFEIEESS